MELQCVKCEGKESKSLPVFRCDGCKDALCKLCAKLTSSEVKVLQLNDRRMKFFCDNCLNFNSLNLMKSHIETKNTLLDSKNEIITMLKSEITKLKTSLEESRVNKNSMNFADIVRSQRSECTTIGQPDINLPCLILKPNKHHDVSITKKDLEAKVNPIAVSAGIKMIKHGKNGSLILKCSSNDSTARIKNEMCKNLGKDYVIDESKLRKPSVRIANMKKMDESVIIEALRNQNSFLTNEDIIELKSFKKANKGDRYYAIIQCNGSAFKKLLNTGRVCMVYEMCPVYENIYVTRCFKCSGFNHVAENCNADIVCPKCAGTHSKNDCNADESKCVNCVNSNNKFKTNFAVDHTVFSLRCESYKKQLELIKLRTDFS